MTQAPPPAQELLDEVAAVGGRWLVTADHGNAEDMVRAARALPPSAPPAQACLSAGAPGSAQVWSPQRGLCASSGLCSLRARPVRPRRCSGIRRRARRCARPTGGRGRCRRTPSTRCAAAWCRCRPDGRCPCAPPRGAARRPRGRAQVPVAIGGPGLPDGVRFRADLPHAGLASVGPTILNLLGFEAPPHMVPTLLA